MGGGRRFKPGQLWVKGWEWFVVVEPLPDVRGVMAIGRYFDDPDSRFFVGSKAMAESQFEGAKLLETYPTPGLGLDAAWEWQNSLYQRGRCTVTEIVKPHDPPTPDSAIPETTPIRLL